MATKGTVSADLLTQERGTAAFLPYNDWFERGYLDGLDHGRFNEHPVIAETIQNTAATDDIRFRGEHLTVHPASDGAAFAVLWEEWFGTGASTWVRHRSQAAARAWTHAVAAHWLREYIGSLPAGGGRLATWGAAAWGAERDLVSGRWNVAVGLAPGTHVSFLATTDPVRGWSFITSTLAEARIHPTQWPQSMRQACASETAPATAALTVTAAATNASYWLRVREVWLLWWRTTLAWVRPGTRPATTSHEG